MSTAAARIALLCAALFSLAPGAGNADAPKLIETGFEFPTIEADTLDGHHVRFPADVNGSAAVFVIGFDRSAETNVKNWSHALTAQLKDRAKVFAVVVASGVPGFAHGFVRGGIGKDAPSSQPEHRSQIILTFRSDGWSSVAPAGSKETPAIVAIDAKGSILDETRAPFSDSAANDVVAKVK